MGKREWVGLKFDMLTVLEELPGNKIKTRCDCGNEKIANKSLFYSKCRKTCGCHVASVVAGVEYGCLTVLEELVASPTGKEGIKHCRVKCRCGNIKDVNRSSVFIGILKTCGCASKRSANLDHHIFKNKNSESLYWAGFIAADGNICNSYLNIGLMESDINHLIKFKEWIKADTKVRLKAKTKSCYFAIKNPVMCEDILKYGIYPRKSLTYDPPLFCEQSVDFWRGMIDGDGHVGGDKALLYLYGTKSTCEAFRRFVETFCESKVKTCPHRTIFAIRYSGKYAIQIMQKLYGNNPKFYLDRKYEFADKFCNFALADDSGIN